MGQKVLHARQRKLLSLLNEQKKMITGVELAYKMEVSDRTIRNDILELNKVLKDINVNIKSIRGKGYILQVENSALLHNFIYAEDILLTQEDRVRYLTIRLISNDEMIELGELEDEMYISRTTLEKDLREVTERYTKKAPYLKLIRKETLIAFENHEEKKRFVLNELYSKEWDYNSEEGMHFRDSFLDAKIFDVIAIEVKETLKKYNIKVSDVGLVHFVFSVAIAHLRIKTSHNLDKIDYEVENDASIKGFVEELSNKLENILNIRFNIYERSYFEFLIMQKKVFDLNIITRENIAEHIGEKYILVVKKLLEAIKDKYVLDITGDDELFIGLVLHTRTLVNRLRYAYELKSVVLDPLKNKYPLAFEMSLEFVDYFKDIFNLEIEENELSYIAAYLGAATKRLVDNALAGEITIAVASHLNNSSTQLLITKLKSIYQESINIKGPYYIYEKEKIEQCNPDLILSTVKLKGELGSKVLAVSSFLENEDLASINKYLENIKRDFIHPKLPRTMENYFPEELFYFDKDFESKEKVIDFLCESLREKGYVTEQFRDEVIKRERLSSTAFDNLIAMPHSMKRGALKSAVAVVILKKPITWQGQKVQCVFLLSIKEDERKYLIRFFDIIVERLNDKSKIKKIIENDTYDKFINAIQ